MHPIEYHEPQTVQEAASLLKEYGPDAKIIAGGTAVVLMMQQKLLAPGHLINLRRVPKLDYIEHEADKGLRLGAMTTLHEVEQSRIVRETCPALAGTCGQVANVRIRNAATLGGNLCEADYASDPPALLLTLGARVRAVSPRGERLIPLDEFFLGYYTTSLEEDEIVTEIQVPEQRPGTAATYIKYISRSSEDRPCVGVAAKARFNGDGTCADLRIAVGAVASVPVRFEDTDALANGERLSDELTGEIAEIYAERVDPLADLRGSKWYRRKMVRVFVQQALQQLSRGSAVIRV